MKSALLLLLAVASAEAAPSIVPSPAQPADDALLVAIEQRAVQYFIDHSDAQTGLTRDRAPADGSKGTAPASMAATGFALSAWCIADARGWMPHDEVRARVLKTLRFVAEKQEHEHGLLYHFVDPVTGRRAWRCEASTIDTALFLQGAVFAREYLHDAETTRLVDAIYNRVDWRWALNGGKTLTHGWMPESGFIAHRWDSYCELMGMYLLAMGASQHAAPADAWKSFSRATVASREGRSFIQCGPLFTHQYSHAWFDFRDKRDGYADYWQNSVDATLAQREWSAGQSKRFAHWSSDVWGLTASDSARGYIAWGTPGRDPDLSDGTLVPCAPGGSLPFAPGECLTALRRMREIGGDAVWGRYGFADAFNPETGWVSPDVIGIDLGIMLVMTENYRSELVWRSFMQAPEVQRGMALAGFAKSESRKTLVEAVPAKSAAKPTAVASSE